MERDRLSRKLAVILHADVVGSTLLVQKNESLAHQRIQAAFNRFSETIAAYGGKAHEIRGDALVAEFNRASDAVPAALAFQSLNVELNSAINDDIQPQLRMGISLGEVVVADNTLTGAGVVLAQRLEQLAESGGVVVQGSVSETVPTRMPFDFESLGEQMLKGFEQPVRAFAARLRPGEELPEPEKDVSQKNSESVIPNIPDVPSIAVLPFTNLSNEPEQEIFCDGITRDIIGDLSRFGDLVVIAANSTFIYKGRPVKVQQVADELGIRYVVEGSIQKAGNQIRINSQLIDAITGKQLWADRFVRDLSDVFALQDEISQKIVSTLGKWSGQIFRATLARAKRKSTTDLTAYENFLLGVELGVRFTKDENARARELFKIAIERDPGYARAYATLAWTHIFDWLHNWSESEELSGELAYECAMKAVEIDDSEAEAHWALAKVYGHIKKRPEEAVAEFEKALALNPNHPEILAAWGGYDMPVLTGRADEGVELVKKAMRLNPSYLNWYEEALGLAAYVAKRYDDANSAFRKVKHHTILSRGTFAANYAQLGRSAEAHAEVVKLLELHPETTIESFTGKLYFKNLSDLDHYKDGIRKAGIPE